MEGIIRSGSVSPSTAEILSHLWVAGVLPLVVGLALVVNGYFVSKKIVELSQQNKYLPPDQSKREIESHLLNAAEISEFGPSGFSVTEGTTKHLSGKDSN
jgi:hypothetical protein